MGIPHRWGVVTLSTDGDGCERMRGSPGGCEGDGEDARGCQGERDGAMGLRGAADSSVCRPRSSRQRRPQEVAVEAVRQHEEGSSSRATNEVVADTLLRAKAQGEPLV